MLTISKLSWILPAVQSFLWRMINRFMRPEGIIGEIRVGSIVRKNLPVNIIDFPPESTLRGLIGMNFLKGLRFTVEMDTGTLILREPKKSKS